MNVMKKAHESTRTTVAEAAQCGLILNYRTMFIAALKDCHKMNKEAQAFKAQTIAGFERRIVELHALALLPEAQKFMVVCGDSHPMPINFDAVDPKWPWVNVEGATKWNSVQSARANASKVVNGNQEVGKAVLVADHIEWDIANLQKLIADLKK